MADKSLDIPNDNYIEDISVTVGTPVITRPAILWRLNIIYEGSGSPVVSISDDVATYNVAHRKDKACFTGPGTVTLGYGKGLNLTRGLVVVSNTASVDVSVVYD